MKGHITSDIKECSASWRQTIFTIYKALIRSLQHQVLCENFDDIPIVNVYEAPGEKGGDWKQYLKDEGEAWILTPLHYSSGTGSRYIRKASGGGRWDDRTGPLPLKKNVDASWVKRKYRLETKEETGLPTYTMLEYLPAQDKNYLLKVDLRFSVSSMASLIGAIFVFINWFRYSIARRLNLLFRIYYKFNSTQI